MKHLVFILCFIYSGATFAETWNCGPKTNGVYSDSVKCTYDEASKTLTISGNGPMGNYDLVSKNDSSTAPWVEKDIVHAVVEDGVTTIGDRVFKQLHNLQDVIGLEKIVSVGDRAFYGASSLTSIDLPNVQTVGINAFYRTSNLQYAGLPDDVVFRSAPATGKDVFMGSGIPNCKTGDCGSCGDKFVQAGAGCVSGCFDGYYPTNQGYCKIIKLRYTLPEADDATSDDYENMIEWIFE